MIRGLSVLVALRGAAAEPLPCQGAFCEFGVYRVPLVPAASKSVAQKGSGLEVGKTLSRGSGTGHRLGFDVAVFRLDN